jgi:hypothetical protein
MGRIKAGAANFFIGVVGSILSSWFTVGSVVAGAAIVLSWFHALGPVWFDRGITALVVLVIVLSGSAIQTLIRRKRYTTEPSLPEDVLNALWKAIHELEGRQLGPGRFDK